MTGQSSTKQPPEDIRAALRELGNTRLVKTTQARVKAKQATTSRNLRPRVDVNKEHTGVGRTNRGHGLETEQNKTSIATPNTIQGVRNSRDKAQRKAITAPNPQSKPATRDIKQQDTRPQSPSAKPQIKKDTSERSLRKHAVRTPLPTLASRKQVRPITARTSSPAARMENNAETVPTPNLPKGLTRKPVPSPLCPFKGTHTVAPLFPRHKESNVCGSATGPVVLSSDNDGSDSEMETDDVDRILPECEHRVWGGFQQQSPLQQQPEFRGRKRRHEDCLLPARPVLPPFTRLSTESRVFDTGDILHNTHRRSQRTLSQYEVVHSAGPGFPCSPAQSRELPSFAELLQSINADLTKESTQRKH
ncbi:hypothetical protein F5Y18DRAFT_322278 [Xylariaceae sp. FL1019]|nr:hypothetical protein F5Y18DRAFT_322278 [Xylariaceae sp. FL1019]